MSHLPESPPTTEPCPRCGEVLDVTAFAPFSRVVCPKCETESRVKREFGAYRLERRHAIGGMSVIFVGWDTLLNRQVAIKVLNEEYCHDENRILAFENEARLTAQVNHPNVIKVYAVGRAYGRFYLVMEFLEGQSFEKIITNRGAIPEAEVLDLAIQVAQGLQAANKAGMIHRDVKPANILFDHEGNARLVDFGIALITQDGSAQAEELFVTPYYVPPETLERSSEDFRSDIYAFGATLYHALTGRPPFESTSTARSVLRRAKQTIPRLTKVTRGIGTFTGEAVDRMMAFKPEHRWQSYHEVIAALEKARLHLGEGTVSLSSRESRRSQKSRYPLFWILAFLVIAGGALLAILEPWKPQAEVIADSPEPLPVEEPAATFNPSNLGEDQDDGISASWTRAREEVANRNYSESEEEFAALAKDESLPASSRAWASLEAAVSASLDGRPADRRRHAGEAFALLKNHESQDPDISKLRDLTSKLQHTRFPAPGDFSRNPYEIVGAMETFALALKLWEQAQWETSLPYFATVRNLKLGDDFRWFQLYQNLADDYLADGVILRSLSEPPDPKNIDEANALITELRSVLDSLKTRGRARFNLRARQAYIARIRKGLQKPAPAPSTLTWPEMSLQLAELGRNYRFKEAQTLLAQAPKDTPPDSLWAWKYLLTQGLEFLADLSASVEDEGVRLANGSLVPFSNLDPASLVTAQSASTQDDSKRITRAICFSWLVGLTDLAEQEAEKLATQDPTFRENWKRVLVGTSQ